jgi:phage-related tail protein
MSDFDWSKMNMATMWRDWIVKSEAQWSDTVSTMLKEKNTSKVLTKQVDEARMMHRMFSEMAKAGLASANLPSRSDFEALDERMGRLEDGIAEIAAAVVQLREALKHNTGKVIEQSKPSRNRKPASQYKNLQQTPRPRSRS